MGHGFIYNCPKCEHKAELLVGVGFCEPNPTEIILDIQKGLYGDKAKDFLKAYPSYSIDAYLEIYQCKCGNIENKYHVVLKAPNVRTLSIRHHCNKCGSVMKKLDEQPKVFPCPECGFSLELEMVDEILWD
jgi:DNA-directed RNA polymerase subunit RPC12/RpoP